MYLLADEPESLRNTSGYKMNKNTTKGFHGTASINAQARKYIDSWTKEEMFIGQDNEGNNLFIPRMYSIKSIGLLEEILAWNSKGNFDRISAIGMLMILREDRAKLEVSLIENKKGVGEDPFFNKHFNKFKTDRAIVDLNKFKIKGIE
jgi:hypothetical protein